MNRSSSSTPPDSDPKSQTHWQRSGEIGLIFLVFFVFGGDAPPHLNEPHYLCRLKHFWNPDWAAGDMFLESRDAHFLVVIMLGWLTKFLTLAATAWILRITTWLALAWAWQRLSFRLVPRPWCAPFAAAIWTLAIEQGNLAGEWVIGGFEAKCISYVFVLLALRELVDNRWNRVWILLGCASAFHVLVGGWSVLVSLGVWATLRWNGWSRREAKLPGIFTMLPGLAFGGAIALLGLVPTLLINRGTPSATVEEANYIYTFVRLPHHLALLHNEIDWLRERVIRHSVVFAIWVLLSWRLWRYRSDTFHGPFGRMILFATGALALAACGFAIELALWNVPQVAAKLQRFYWYRLNDITAAAVAAWLLVEWISELLANRRSLGVWLLVAVLAAVGFRMGQLAYNRSIAPAAPADAKMLNVADWLDACEWIAEHTPTDAMFFVPRESHSFKWHTGRPEVVTRKDMPQDATGIVEWRDRMKDVFYSTHGMNETWLANPDLLRLPELTHKYQADFLIMDDRELINLPVVYRNDTYRVYDLRRLKTTPTLPSDE